MFHLTLTIFLWTCGIKFSLSTSHINECDTICAGKTCGYGNCNVWHEERNNAIFIKGNNSDNKTNDALIVCKKAFSEHTVGVTRLTNFEVESIESCRILKNSLLQRHITTADKVTVSNLGKFTKNFTDIIFMAYIPLSASFLNFSQNIVNVTLEISTPFPNLQSMILSENHIGMLDIQTSFPKLTHLRIGSNPLIYIFGLSRLDALEDLKILNSNLKPVMLSQLPSTLINLTLENAINFQDTEDIYFPYLNSLVNLNLRKSEISNIDKISEKMFVKMPKLETLDLSSNRIRRIHSKTFSRNLHESLIKLLLNNNQITYLGKNSFADFKKLKHLDLRKNLLQHIPILSLSITHQRVVRDTSELLKNNSSLQSSRNTSLPDINLNHNPWSCDCMQLEYHSWLISTNQNRSNLDVECHNPPKLYGRYLTDLKSSELKCLDVTVEGYNTTGNEFEDKILYCNVTGAPMPIPYWISPINETISAEDSDHDTKKYKISPDGTSLTILSLAYFDTGTYRCVADNTISSKNATFVLGIILSAYGTVIAVTVSSVAFCLAITLNLVNLFNYLCDHITKQRQKAAARKHLREEQENLEKAKLREKEFYESAASLNANKFYGKYDFTCQQMFLDTMVKGAHSVKKTIYDAKHSDFSNNMWGYAAHLRDRLHIELPSSMQLPRVSMPTISMPNISIPSFQGINTNIEKIGSSVMNRSHKIGTSVGSVFTLRWLRSANPSDQSSGDESCNEAGPSKPRQVQVHIHHHHRNPSMESSSSTQSNVVGELPSVLRQTNPLDGDKGQTPRRTKSVRFHKSEKYVFPGKLRRTASYTAANPSLLSVNKINVDFPNEKNKKSGDQETQNISTVSHSVHEFETCL